MSQTHHLACAQWCPTKSRDHGGSPVQPVQPARKLRKVCGTENILTIASKLKKNISSSYCAVIASQNISVRCEGCHDTMTNDTLFLLLDGRVARKSRGVLGAQGPWQVSESCRRICESFKVFWTSSHFCSACLPLVTLNSYANLTKWNFYASNLDLMFRATKWETLTQVQCETTPK